MTLAERRTHLAKDATTTIFSIGGMGSTYLLDTLQSFKELKVCRSHSITKDMMQNPAQKYIYLFNDPLLALLSRFRRNILYTGWAKMYSDCSLHLLKSNINKTILNKVYEEFISYGAFLQNSTETFVGKLPLRYETHFAYRFFDLVQTYGIDFYTIKEHFFELFSKKDQLNILFLDLRENNSAEKLSDFLKQNIKLTQKPRNSKKLHVKKFDKLNYKNIISTYEQLDYDVAALLNNA